MTLLTGVKVCILTRITTAFNCKVNTPGVNHVICALAQLASAIFAFIHLLPSPNCTFERADNLITINRVKMFSLINRTLFHVICFLFIISQLDITAQGGTLGRWKGKLVYFDPNARDFYQSEEFCKKLGGKFPEIESQEDIEQLNQMFYYYTRVWIDQESPLGNTSIHVDPQCDLWASCCLVISGKILLNTTCTKEQETVCVFESEVPAIQNIINQRQVVNSSIDFIFLTDLNSKLLLEIITERDGPSNAAKLKTQITSIERKLKVTSIVLVIISGFLVLTISALILGAIFNVTLDPEKRMKSKIFRRRSYKLKLFGSKNHSDAKGKSIDGPEEVTELQPGTPV